MAFVVAKDVGGAPVVKVVGKASSTLPFLARGGLLATYRPVEGLPRLILSGTPL